jgi:hypothetical protein
MNIIISGDSAGDILILEERIEVRLANVRTAEERGKNDMR